MIQDEIGRLPDLLPSADLAIPDELRDDILDIRATPGPPAKLLVLGFDRPPEIGLLDDIHLHDRRDIHDPEYPIEGEIAPPILESVLDDRGFRPVS